MDQVFKEIHSRIKDLDNIDEIKKATRQVCIELTPKKMPTLIQIFLSAPLEQRKRLFDILKSKPSRNISGVNVVAVMSKPAKCPHGKCTMCPGGLDSEFGDVPQSYTGHEPATLRAQRANYNPYVQVFTRLLQYILLGYIPSKIELIIMGGTFNAQDREYQQGFITKCYQAMNDFGNLFLQDGLDFDRFTNFFELDQDNEFSKERTDKINNKVLELIKEKTLEEVQLENETTQVKCIALCLETRPDCCSDENIKQMLELGTTRIELGLQSVYDDVLDKIERGHSVQDTIQATKRLKNSGLKVGYHILLGAPNSNKEKDIEMFKILFENQNFKPDALKIYPCMVLKGTKLYEQGFKPITTQEAVEIIKEGKKCIPKYCRVMRIQRDIPTKMIDQGVDVTNLRQYISDVRCQCIRCREIGRIKSEGEIKLKVLEYQASDGKEYFISYESDNALVGFLRLRVVNDLAFVRELHVYGETALVGEKGKVQHQGYGKKLMLESEKISKGNNVKKIKVISGIGVKEYYKKLDYHRDETYMSKVL